MAPRNWAQRYRDGERDEVWHELRQAGAAVRDRELVEDAQAVCDEMARRARQNVETIVERLRAQGFVCHTNDDARTPLTPHHPPGPRAEEVIAWLTDRFGAVPMTLGSWMRHVGDVWFVGTHPAWPESSSADPLVIELEGSAYPDHSIVEDYFEERVDAYEEERAQGFSEPFELPVSPDRLHKENTSGGGPYGIVLPDACADGLFVGEVTMPFVAYLRWVFANGGFPVTTGDTAAAWRVRQELAADLLPL